MITKEGKKLFSLILVLTVMVGVFIPVKGVLAASSSSKSNGEVVKELIEEYSIESGINYNTILNRAVQNYLQSLGGLSFKNLSNSLNLSLHGDSSDAPLIVCNPNPKENDQKFAIRSIGEAVQLYPFRFASRKYDMKMKNITAVQGGDSRIYCRLETQQDDYNSYYWLICNVNEDLSNFTVAFKSLANGYYISLNGEDSNSQNGNPLELIEYRYNLSLQEWTVQHRSINFWVYDANGKAVSLNTDTFVETVKRTINSMRETTIDRLKTYHFMVTNWNTPVNVGGKCAKYAANCLNAGGIESVNSGYVPTFKKEISAIAEAHTMKSLSYSDNPYLEVGDCVVYGGRHVVIISSICGNSIYYAAHNNPHAYAPLYKESGATYYHIK